MSNTTETDHRVDVTAPPAQGVIARIRRLIVVALIAGIGCVVLTSASKGYCPGGVGANGGFIDKGGNPVDTAPSCVNLTLHANPIVYAAIALVVVWALGRVLRGAADERSATRILARAQLVVIALAVASVLISQVWFWMIPVTDWNGSATFFYPLPFGSVDLSITPMKY